MNLWQLKILVAVVEHKSFSKASEAINLSQPTVSSHIKELEEYFKCPLLDPLSFCHIAFSDTKKNYQLN